MGRSIALTLLLTVSVLAADRGQPTGPFTQWTLEESIRLVNDSAWASQVTFTRLIGGVGSGVQGEKEIFNTFYARILSAQPVRHAFARIEQINHGYDEMNEAQRLRFDELIEPGLTLDMSEWIVISVSFRSNDAGRENRLKTFFRTRTAETLQNSAFLSSRRFPQIQLLAYHPPQDDGVGAKFVFPKTINGQDVVGFDDETLVFELEAPSAEPILSVTFPVNEMIVDGKLEL